MQETTSMRRWSDAADRVKAWWDSSTFLGDVALVFTAVTVVNSVMMLTGWDEPKTGTFAYVHLLGRLGIITVVVGLFYLEEFRDGLARWRRAARPHPHGGRRTAIDAVLEFATRAPVASMARVFTAVVAVTCVVTLALADVQHPTGGPGLYRNLVVLAALLLLAMVAFSRWWRRTVAPRSDHSWTAAPVAACPPSGGDESDDRERAGHGARRGCLPESTTAAEASRTR